MQDVELSKTDIEIIRYLIRHNGSNMQQIVDYMSGLGKATRTPVYTSVRDLEALRIVWRKPEKKPRQVRVFLVGLDRLADELEDVSRFGLGYKRLLDRLLDELFQVSKGSNDLEISRRSTDSKDSNEAELNSLKAGSDQAEFDRQYLSLGINMGLEMLAFSRKAYQLKFHIRPAVTSINEVVLIEAANLIDKEFHSLILYSRTKIEAAIRAKIYGVTKPLDEFEFSYDFEKALDEADYRLFHPIVASRRYFNLGLAEVADPVITFVNRSVLPVLSKWR